MARLTQLLSWCFATPLPMFGKASAAAFLCGICTVMFAPVLLPTLPAWCALLAGVPAWCGWRGGRWCGALLVGVGWAALQAHAGLALQLPPGAPPVDHRVRGTVVDLPQHGPRSSRFRFRVDDDPAMPAHLRGRELTLAWYDRPRPDVDAPRHALRAGAHWQMQVRLRPPRGLRNPGGFDAERHALLQRLTGTGHVRAPAASLGPPRGLPAWRERMATAIAAQVPGQGARFVQALALGDTRGLQQADWDDLRALGLTHLVAISGFHVGLVAGFAAWLVALAWRAIPAMGRYLPRPLAAAAGAVAGAGLYAAVAGFALPTVRTLLMIAVVALARCAPACHGRAVPGAGRAGNPAGRSPGGTGAGLLAELWRGAVAGLVPARTQPALAARLPGRAGRSHAGAAAVDGGAVRPGLACGTAGQPAGHSVVEPGGGAAGVAGDRAGGAVPGRRVLAMALGGGLLRGELVAVRRRGEATVGAVVGAIGGRRRGTGRAGRGVLAAAAPRRGCPPAGRAAVPAAAVAGPRPAAAG